jgi:hypothetical protein
MVKKLILAVKEGGVSGSGLLAGLPFLLSSSHAQHSIEGRGCRFFEVFCGYGQHRIST